MGDPLLQGLTGDDILSLPESAFIVVWGKLSDAQRSEIGAAGFERYRKIDPYGSMRSAREQAAREERAGGASKRVKGNGDAGPINGSREAQVASKAKPAPPRYPRVWLDDAVLDLTNNDHVTGVIGASSLVLAYGPSGDGKTFFIVDLLAHIASGKQWRGRRVRPCLCVYVAAEAGVGVIKRFVACRERLLPEVREKRIPLCIITRAANLLDLRDVDSLVAELHAMSHEASLPIGIVAFDTLSRSTPGGDENAAADVTRAIAVADRLRDELGATTLFVHHSGKNLASGARGHSALEAAADAVIEVVERVATIKKSRDGATGQSFAFKLEVVELGKDDAGDLVTTCIVMPGEATAGAERNKRKRLTGAGNTAMKALQEAISADGRHMPQTFTVPNGVCATTLDRWRAQFTVRYGRDGSRDREPDTVRKAFSRAKDELLKHSMIDISDPHVWVSP